MKVKNIAFSGFAAMIFAGLCGVADAASVNLASKSYVDEQLAGKANLIDLESLETTVGQKATQESLEIVATQVNKNTTDIATLMGKEYLTNDDLTALRTALETEIAKKQDSGDYATADALKTVSDSLGALKNDVYTKAEVDQKIADAVSGGEIDLSGYAQQSALDALVLLVNGNTDKIAALEKAGYQTSADVQGAITTATADLATKSELNAKQGKLTAGANIEIADDNTISANVDLSGLATEEALNNLQTTLTDLIDAKQAKGDYLVAADLTTLNDAVSALQTGKADASTVETIQETISKLGDTYASDADLKAAIDAINIPSLEGYVKSSDLAAVATSGSYNDLDDKPTIPSIDGLATTEALTNLQTTLQAAIDDKQAKGDYLTAESLTTLNEAITALQTGKADASTVATIQETISKLGDTYATKSDMTAADTALQNAIDAIEIPSLAEYAKTADVDAKLALKADASALTGLVTSTELSELRTALEAEIEKKQNSGDYATADALKTVSDSLATLTGDVYTKAQVDAKIAEAVSGGEIDLSGYAKQVDLDSLTALVNGNTAEITALKNAGYQTSAQVSEAISTATATLATKDELNAKQDTLTAGTGITITDNTISASVDTESLITKPTEQPSTFGEYVLILNINEAGESEGYSWLDTLDLMGDSGFDM